MSYTAVSQPVHTSVLKSSLSIRFIEERQRKEQVEVAIATKFAALPWRFGRGSVICALKALLDRLGVSSVELYQLHWLAHHPLNRLCFSLDGNFTVLTRFSLPGWPWRCCWARSCESCWSLELQRLLSDFGILMISFVRLGTSFSVKLTQITFSMTVYKKMPPRCSCAA
jgi:hypothetical protein